MEDDDRKIIFLRQPDQPERIIRLVCGGILGLVVGGWTSFRFRLSWPVGLGVTIAAVVFCARGALKHGDDFWYRFFGK